MKSSSVTIEMTTTEQYLACGTLYCAYQMVLTSESVDLSLTSFDLAIALFKFSPE